MAKKTKPVNKQRPARFSMRRFGIANHLGGVWTPETFQTAQQAGWYLTAQNKIFGGTLSKHKVVPVRVTVSIIAPR